MADAATLASALEDRSYTGNILPFKTDKAGALSFAVPEMLQSLYRGGKELLNGPRDTTPGQTSLSPDALGALAAVMGVPGMATAERGAVGIAGGRLPTASLPMDEASRMARAKEMGFDLNNPLFRGTITRGEKRAPVSFEAGQGVFTSTNPDVAELFRYPREWGEIQFDAKPGDLQKLYTNIKNPLTLGPKDAEKFSLDTIYQVQVLRHAKANGYDAVIAPNVMEGAGDTVERGTTYAILDPKNLRKTDAAFDPAKRDSADLLAASGPAVLAAAPKSRRDLLAEQISKVEK